MNCDSLAACYRSLEFAAFGRGLEKARFAFLGETARLRRALVLGEGDGRFVCALARENVAISIDCVEASGRMIETARKRLRSEQNIGNPERIRFTQRDARLGPGSEGRYDLIVTHFFLDCFSDAEVRKLIAQLRKVCVPGAIWLIAEFQQPQSGWRRWYADAWLAAMYTFFRVATGLETRALPNYRACLVDAGFSLRHTYTSHAQLIGSEVWELAAQPDATEQ